jgi:hypothetical protein
MQIAPLAFSYRKVTPVREAARGQGVTAQAEFTYLTQEGMSPNLVRSSRPSYIFFGCPFAGENNLAAAPVGFTPEELIY